MRERGHTLVELLLVLFIVGLGWFTLLPRLDPSSREGELDTINTMLHRAGKRAVDTYAVQRVRLFPGRDYLEWEQDRFPLPAVLSGGEINGRRMTGQESSFALYPSGHMDEVNLLLTSGERLRSRPLMREIMAVNP